MRVIRKRKKQKSKDKSDLAVPENSDSQAVLVYYEMGFVENFHVIL